LSLGNETLGGVFTRLIEKNTTIPTRKSQIFSTASDNQPSVSIHVLQGEREMAANNKTLGRFELVGIPPAPRGMPQIEVTFDIDANGIVHVSAKDLGTGKEQSIKITASSGMTEEEIQRMVKDAEAHAEEDRSKRELIDIRNQADSTIYMTEKSLKEYGDKVDSSVRSAIEAAIAKTKRAMEGSDTNEIKTSMEELQQASHKLAEAMYQQASSGAGGGTDTGSTGGGGSQSSAKPEEDVVDADFEEVKDSKK
ncbi:MAG: Hsp70 family protein, partial [Deltaproteobacteria bacterium]|nr:Hsp70 family protein [Deltaproteobacteria bacterium]